jgi:hypothetical protein
MINIKDSKRKKYFIIIGFILLVILIYSFNSSRKPFPVHIGQTWIIRQNVIPFDNNHPEPEVSVEYYVKVIDIKDDGNIVYSRGCDTMELYVENFIFNAELIDDK